MKVTNVIQIVLFAFLIPSVYLIIRYGKPVVTISLATSDECRQCQIYDIQEANNFDYQCVEMKSVPPTPICIYPADMDIYISNAIFTTGEWEPMQVKWMQKVLRNNQDMGLIDIGANIGVFSLTAAAMGHNVLSVEPKLENARRLHKAVKLGNLEDRITLLTNVISDGNGAYKLTVHGPNQGAITAEEVRVDDKKNNTNGEMYARSITMNDLVHLCNFKRAFLKIDIEGNEPKAIAGSDKFFEKLDIPYIFMEWFHVKTNIMQNESQDSNLGLKMLKSLEQREYHPVSITHEALNLSKWDSWPDDIIWKKEVTI